MFWLNYHHLLYFWVVAREGGLAPAGKVLRLSHPTLSSQVKKLEEALGAWVNESLGTLAQAREATCSPAQGRPQQLECKVGAAFLRGEEPGRFYVAELGRDADRVAKYPAAPCAP